MKKPKPFFAKFLENQLCRQQEARLKGGDGHHTDKYPSDNEDGDPLIRIRVDIDWPNTTTDKYPSDQEDS